MKVLLALSIILGGVLITQNSFANSSGQSIVTGSDSVQVSGFKPQAHMENAPGGYHCPLHNSTGNKSGAKNIASGLNSVKSTK